MSQTESSEDLEQYSGALKQREMDPLRDPRFYLGIVYSLVGIALISILSYVALLLWSTTGKEVDTALLTLASAAVGALAATLTRGIGR